MTDQIIWQPQAIYQPGYSFGILLHPEFAKRMLESKLTSENYRRIQNLPKELMGFSGSEPYIFHKDTCFARQINLDAGDGKWLSLDDACGGAIPDLSKPVKYSTHNFDYKTNSIDVLTLMRLFDLWVEYSEFLKNE